MKKKMNALKDRLNDLSRNNRSVRMLKLYDKWSFDINNVDRIGKDPSSLLSQLLEKREKTLVKRDAGGEESFLLSVKLNSLYRNMKRIEEETGAYDLYLGYPFISGNMLDGTYIRAPLFLYPIRLEKVKKHGIQWDLSPITDEAPQLNRPLFLTMQKLSNLYVPEAMYDEAETKARHASIQEMAAWLNSYSLNIDDIIQESLSAFQSYRKEEIPNFNKGTFQLNNIAILGHFPQGNSAMLKDYETFMEYIEEGYEDFGLASKLLNVGEDGEELITDNLEGPHAKDNRGTFEKEKSKTFVLDTDASQEAIIESLDHEKGLVVHGPPGTGKSQVIVNMISDAMANNKKVVLVTQKRAALDVVYQRLDSLGLSSNVALLHDEKHDRRALYQKINGLLSHSPSYGELEREFEQLSEKIIKTEQNLDAIAKGLFEVQPHGFRAYDLYGLSRTANEQEGILELENTINELNKNNLDEVLMKVFSFGEYYSRFGAKDYPLKGRKSFAALEMKDRVRIVEILKKAMEKAKQSIDHLEHFEDEAITPEYSWENSAKLEKIYSDLTSEEKKTLQKLRLWWWTSITGKTIVEELTEGEKFQGLSSKEWPKLRQSLAILYELSLVSEEMSNELDGMKLYLSDEFIEGVKERISVGDIPLNILDKQSEYVKQDFDELRNMDRMYDESPAFMRKIFDKLKDKDVGPTRKDLGEHWQDLTEQSAYLYWIDEVERKHPALNKIGTNEFDYMRQQLKELLEEKQRLSIRMLQYNCEESLENVKMNHRKAMKDVVYQTGKKRQIWPVRKLVNEYALQGLLDVMPVWLLSPEMVSSVFPLKEGMFDLVIFDEASQCTVENGIPAIYRGKQAVVAGDEKQLPPSNLFKGTVDEDEDDEEQDDFVESETLLNLAKRVLPEKLLEWHYRSKSEELINFSNHAYYNGNVQIAPNVNHMENPSSIQWHKTNGRWINQHNAVEAEAVVDLLKTLLIKDKSKTIGIITFNAKQQDVIENAIEERAEKDKEFGVVYEQVMAGDLDERIFVKNIENVQGDERDIILFSVAYAKNKEGKIHSRFGTLGQQGGENRLNVAVTRAKEQIHLVSSIEPFELNVSNAKNEGPRLLKNYLEYAKAVSDLNKEKIDSVLVDLNEEKNTMRQDLALHFDSPFEEEVYEKLTAVGYKVDTQVGMSGYRIDMAVVHPKEPHRYILGIECDGAMYHSAPSARERDVYRQRFLESKGWTITRIWSRSWWKDSFAEIERIDRLVRESVRETNSQENKITRIV